MTHFPAGDWLKQDCKTCLGMGCCISVDVGIAEACRACDGDRYKMVWHRIEVKYIPEPDHYNRIEVNYIPEPHPGTQTEKRNDHV